jgi:hypothetical protein
MEILNNEAFSQALSSELSFEAKKKKSSRRMVRRVSSKRPKGQKVYAKSGKVRLGRWVRV